VPRHRWSAKRALDQAKLQAALSGPLVEIPSWARMPSRFGNALCALSVALKHCGWLGI
jgi:hypothetical protein